MAYNHNYSNQYYNNGSYNSTNQTHPTNLSSPYANEISGNYYNNHGPSSTSNYFPTNQRAQDLNQRYLTNIDNGNYSTRSLGGATAVETPRVNPTRNAGDVDLSDSSPYSHQPGAYNYQDQTATTNDTAGLQGQSLYGDPQYAGDNTEEPESFSDSEQSKRESKPELTSTPLIDKSTYDLGGMGGQHFHDYNASDGYFSRYNNYYRQDDPYYDEEATRRNTLTSNYQVENDYTDRDFPGGGKEARQHMSGEHFVLPEKKRRCSCCSWSVCLFITLIILTGLGITGFFVWPRIPKVNVKNAIPKSQPNLSTNPPFIEMEFNMVVEIDNRENYVPYKFNKIDVAVFDRAANNGKSIATGSKPDYTLPPKRIDTIEFPLTVDYKAKDVNDPVIVDFVAACSPKSKTNAPLRLKVDVELFVWGIDWVYKPKISVPIPDMKCPVPEF